MTYNVFGGTLSLTQSIINVSSVSVCVCQVALVFPNNEPISFICAFYGCLTAGLVPVPIEVPLMKRVCVAFTHFC